MLKVKITYPTRDEEMKILHRNVGSKPAAINPIIKIENILKARNLIHDIYVDEKIEKYILIFEPA